MKWHSGDEKPKRSGWYIRDYSAHNKTTYAPRFCVDYYNADEFWYVAVFEHGEWKMDDAAFTNLPWAKIKDYPK